MYETKKEFEQEIKTAIKYTLEIEKHLDDMDADDIKYLCEKIRMALGRVLQDTQSGNIKAERL
jgi:predicted secreted protein